MTGDVTPLGDDALSLAAPDAMTAQGIAARLQEAGLFTEVVPGLASVAVQFDPRHLSIADARAALSAAANAGPARLAAAALPVLALPMAYGGEDGPDLAAVAEGLGLSEAALIETHTGLTFRVEVMGFTPGFAYLAEETGALDWSVPRRGTPRARVPAGSVGLAGAQTGLYALDGPGGWPLIGRTTAPLFDAGREDPFLLSAGRRVRFEAAS